mgnify:CR=1 FL=1|tara:strand:+ start:267 stop:1247 length:981 start_codon:yes stop_codon:yes gene_type:complete
MARTTDQLLDHIRGLMHIAELELYRLDKSPFNIHQDAFGLTNGEPSLDQMSHLVDQTAALFSYDVAIPKRLNIDVLNDDKSILLWAMYHNRERFAKNLNLEIAQLVNSNGLGIDEIIKLRNALGDVVRACMVNTDIFCTEWAVYVYATWYALECSDSTKHNIPPNSVTLLYEIEDAVNIWFSLNQMNDYRTHLLFTSLIEGLAEFYGLETAIEFCNKDLLPIIFRQKAISDEISGQLIAYEWEQSNSARENVLDFISNGSRFEEWYYEFESLLGEWEDNDKYNTLFLFDLIGDSLVDWLHKRESVITGTSLEEFILNMEHPPLPRS